MQISATLALNTQDIIGEGPSWDASRERFLWTDNKQGIVHEARQLEKNGWSESRRWNLGRRVGAVVARKTGGFVVNCGMDVCIMDDADNVTVLASIDAGSHHFHPNDAKCDPQGRLWAGWLDGDVNISGHEVTPGRSALYRIDPDGTVEKVLEGVTVSNGMAWSPDGSTFYYIDSQVRRIDAFDFDAKRGRISNRRPIVTFAPGDGVPDGMTADSVGSLWVAVPGTGEVRCYAPGGALLKKIDVPTPTPTSCAFGGRDGGDLFITSARVRLPEAAFYQLTRGISVEAKDFSTDAGAGALYVCRPGATGTPTSMFAG